MSARRLRGRARSALSSQACAFADPLAFGQFSALVRDHGRYLDAEHRHVAHVRLHPYRPPSHPCALCTRAPFEQAHTRAFLGDHLSFHGMMREGETHAYTAPGPRPTPAVSEFDRQQGVMRGQSPS